MTCSAEQLSAMMDYLDEHKDLARGQLRSTSGRVKAKRLWQELTLILNSIGGGVKTVQKWQKVWTDRKHLAKKNATLIRGLGPGQGSEPASWELRILSIMGDGFGTHETIDYDPMINSMNFDDDASDTSIKSPSPTVDQKPGTSFAPNLAKQLATHLPKHPVSRVTVNSLRGPTRRRRRDINESCATDRLLRYEKEKLDIMRGIREGLKGLTSAVKELVELKKNENNRAH